MNTAKRFIRQAALSFGLFSLCATLGGQEQVTPSERIQELLDLERPAVIAHRGYSMAAPENTIPAFELGVLSKADLVELDYFHSQEGVPVVFHDWTLDRTTNVRELWNRERVNITQTPLEELRELDAGAWFHPRFAGTGIPTLEEALDVIQPGSITLVERKHGDPATLIELLSGKAMLEDVVIQAFDWEFLAGCNELAPGAVLGALGPPRQADGSRYPVNERYLSEYFLEKIEETGAQFIGWNRQVTPEGIEMAHARGFKVWVYTINELDRAVGLLEMGVDGIITDNPSMGWKAVVTYQQGQTN